MNLRKSCVIFALKEATAVWQEKKKTQRRRKQEVSRQRKEGRRARRRSEVTRVQMLSSVEGVPGEFTLSEEEGEEEE